MWSRIKPRKMYSSLFLYSCLAVCLLTLAFTMYLSRLFVQSAMEEINTSNQDKMQQVVQTSEFTLQKLRQFALRVYSEENIALWLNMNRDDYSPLPLYKAAASVREFVNSEPFIQSICLFNFNINQIYSSSEASLYTPQDFYDQSMLNAIKSKGKTPYLQFFDHNVQGKSYLALVVPAAGPNRNYSGYVSILFSKPMLNEHMLQISEQDQNKMIIEGPNQEFILGNADAELMSELTKAEKPASAASRWEWPSGEGDLVDPDGIVADRRMEGLPFVAHLGMASQNRSYPHGHHRLFLRSRSCTAVVSLLAIVPPFEADKRLDGAASIQAGAQRAD